MSDELQAITAKAKFVGHETNTHITKVESLLSVVGTSWIAILESQYAF